MKRAITTVLLLAALQAGAQWSDTTNFFEDTLHMPVGVATGAQRNPIVLNSYPDGGFIVVWEDERDMATNNTDIYAQKYDKHGNRLWAENGIPIATNPTREHYTFSSNQDNRNRSFMATDSAGGFYLCFSEDSVSQYNWEKVTVQHVRSNGTKVFSGSGHIFARSITANLQMMAQLVPDGNRGFYLAYKYRQGSFGNDYIITYCYRDENGTMRFYGGGRMNENAIQTSTVAPCGTRTFVEYPSTDVLEYAIWPDGDGGCSVIMSLSGNAAGQHAMMGYNRLWRCKKDSKVQTYFRNTSGTACPRYSDYKKGDVYRLFTLATDFQSVACGGGGGPLYTYTNYRLLSNGFMLLDNQGYDYGNPKGATVTTAGNINVDIMGVTRRTYNNSVLSDFIVYGYSFPIQKNDSVPYQRATHNNPDIGYNPSPPGNMSRFTPFRDTLLAFSNYYQDFCVASGSNHFYTAGVMAKTGNRKVLLQHLTVAQKAVDSFVVEYDTDIAGDTIKYGRTIGSELNPGTNGAGMSFDVPHITVTRTGKAFFSILEAGVGPRVSPIQNGTALQWGAMGRTTGTGVYNGSYYATSNPVFAIDSNGRTGIMVWSDTRYVPPATGDNVFMRQINKLDNEFYYPPLKPAKPAYYAFSDIAAYPAVLYGTTRQNTPIELYNSYNATGFSTVAVVNDVLHLGHVNVHVYQHQNAARRYNGVPYLNRNITIKTDSLPPGGRPELFLYFTNTEFDLLKAADITIANPDDLVAVRQPAATAVAPATYSPVAGEEILAPVLWDSVPGGYYIKLNPSGFGNFFIQKMPTAAVCGGVSTSFTASVSGATYLWQVNTGSGFTSISNNATYSGATTATLQINNPPSAFSGYRYRCVVNGTLVSNSFYLQVANTWTGAVNNQWETPGNWSCGTVPDANTDVIINSGTVTVNSNASCRTLKVSPGASVVVATGFTITVTH